MYVGRRVSAQLLSSMRWSVVIQGWLRGTVWAALLGMPFGAQALVCPAGQVSVWMAKGMAPQSPCSWNPDANGLFQTEQDAVNACAVPLGSYSGIDWDCPGEPPPEPILYAESPVKTSTYGSASSWYQWTHKPGCGGGGRYSNNNTVNTYEVCAAAIMSPPEDRPNLGCPAGQPATGQSCGVANPINVANGNKHELATDYQSPGPSRLRFSRAYNSQIREQPGYGPLGSGWRHTYSRRLYKTPRHIRSSLYRSSQYANATQDLACRNGWAQIAAQSLRWADTTAVYEGSSCNLYRGGVKVGTAPFASSLTDQPEAWYAERADGKTYRFDLSNFSAAIDLTAKLERTATGLRLIEGDIVEDYDAEGRLLSIVNPDGYRQTLVYNGDQLATVTDSFQRSLSFAYYPDGRLRALTVPGNQTYTYGYDDTNLTSVTGPDNKPRTYHYEDTRFPSALTGITDEGNNRYATWGYDAAGRATLSTHANDADKTIVAYNADGTRSVTHYTQPDQSYTRTYELGTTPSGAARVMSITQPCAGCPTGGKASYTFDLNGFLDTFTDRNGHVSDHSFGARGLETSRTEADGTPQARTITTQWHPDYRLPTQVDEPGRRTVDTYDAQGNRSSQIITDTITGESRTTRYTHTAQGLIETVDGPRIDFADITTYGYDAQGNLIRVTNAIGQVTELTAHDAHGNPLRIVDANGVETLLTYDVRQRLKSATAGGEVTQYDYDNVGQLTKVTLPDGSFLQYSYDPAHRLTGIQDHQGNRIAYTLDLAGNRTAEEIVDASNTLRRRQTRAYDALSRLQELRGAGGQVTAYGYDANGNLTQTTDPLSQVTGQSYDALNRLTQVTDATNGITRYEYNALDQLTAVTDPRGLITRYTVNAFGEVTRLESPDTSITASTYDAAGNLKTRIDAKNQATAYDYDALNRLTQITYADDSTVTYSYDQGTHGIGRLTGMTDASGSTAWTYDLRGRVIQKTQTVGSKTLTTKYAYNDAGQLIRTTLPSGRVVRHEWAGGKVINLYVDNGPITGAHVVSQITHHAFGPPATWQFGNGEVTERSYDLDGRLTAHALGMLGYDDASRVVSLVQSNRSALNGSKTYGYDALDRLSSYQDTASSIVYSYDATGNRTQQVGAGTNVSYGVDPSSNRISQVDTGSATASYEYDANGSLTDDGTHVYAYDAAGRLRSTETGTYSYNGLGQRVQKVVSNPVSGGLDGLGLPVQQTLSTTTLFAYDEAGHLLGEYDGDGNLIQETLWLGDLPMVVLKPEATYYIHADHLNTPRQIDNSAQQAVWTWDTITFGGNTPSQPAAGAAANFQYNLRFAGQYYDAETGLFQNWNRDYSPNLGRYVESDPIGLAGGLNTYAYVGNDPLGFIDPEGLTTRRPTAGPGAPMSIAESARNARVIRLTEQIRLYDPTFRYAIHAPPNYRYSRHDVEFLQSVLRWREQGEGCFNYGSTPQGRPLTRHYSTETGPTRNVPGSLIDSVVNRVRPVRTEDGRAIYSDPVNDITVVIGTHGVMSVRRGPPRSDQQ